MFSTHFILMKCYSFEMVKSMRFNFCVRKLYDDIKCDKKNLITLDVVKQKAFYWLYRKSFVLFCFVFGIQQLLLRSEFYRS